MVAAFRRAAYEGGAVGGTGGEECWPFKAWDQHGTSEAGVGWSVKYFIMYPLDLLNDISCLYITYSFFCSK